MESIPSAVMPGGWMLMSWLILQVMVVAALAQSAWWISARLRVTKSLAERSLAALMLLLGLLTLIPMFWGLLGLLSDYSMIFTTGIVWMLSWVWARPASAIQALARRSSSSTEAIPLLLQIAVVGVICVYLIPLLRTVFEVPVRWDSLTYHLFLPAQWIESQTVENLEFPYPLNFVGHYPKHQELLLTSLMVVARNDVFSELGSFLLYPTLALAVGCLCMRLGSSRNAGLAAGLFVLTLPAHLTPAAGAYADGFLAVTLVSSLVFGLAAIDHRLDEPRRWEALFLTGLAVGLAAGAKYTALEFGLFLLVMLAWMGWRQGMRGRELLPRLSFFLVISVLSGGVWYALNFAGHGNPFYPVPIGPLPGLHHLGLDWGSSILDRLGPLVRSGDLMKAWFGFSQDRPGIPLMGLKLIPVTALAVYGAWALLRRRTAGAGWVVLGFAVLALGYLRLPFWNVGWLSTQTRFAIPALCVGAALGFSALSQRGASVGFLVLLVVVGFVLDAPVLDLTVPDLGWDSNAGQLMVAGSPVIDRLWVGRLLAMVVFGIGAGFCLLRSRSEAFRRQTGWRVGWTLGGLVVLISLIAVPYVREPLRYEQVARVGLPGPKTRYVKAAAWLEDHYPAVPAAVAASGNLEFLYLFSGRSLDRLISDGRLRGRQNEEWKGALEASRSELLIALRWPGFSMPPEENAASEVGWSNVYEDDWVSVFIVPRRTNSEPNP